MNRFRTGPVPSTGGGCGCGGLVLFRGPKGDKGDTGPQGPQGPAGDGVYGNAVHNVIYEGISIAGKDATANDLTIVAGSNIAFDAIDGRWAISGAYNDATLKESGLMSAETFDLLYGDLGSSMLEDYEAIFENSMK